MRYFLKKKRGHQKDIPGLQESLLAWLIIRRRIVSRSLGVAVINSCSLYFSKKRGHQKGNPGLRESLLAILKKQDDATCFVSDLQQHEKVGDD